MTKYAKTYRYIHSVYNVHQLWLFKTPNLQILQFEFVHHKMHIICVAMKS